MKKTMVKLNLSRETLRNLEEVQIRQVVGGNTRQLSCDTVTFHCATQQSNCC